RRPPGPTLFPYTTLFRSGELPGPGQPSGRWRRGPGSLRGAARKRRRAPPRRGGSASVAGPPRLAHRARGDAEVAGRADGAAVERSEEHTSELQSLAYLVC